MRLGRFSGRKAPLTGKPTAGCSTSDCCSANKGEEGEKAGSRDAETRRTSFR